MYFWCILFRKVKQKASESAGGGFPSWKRASKKSTNQENSSKSFEVPGRGLGITWCTHPHSTYPWQASIQRSGLFSSSLSNHKDGWTTPSQKQGSCHTAITSDYSGTNQTGFGQFIIKEERWIYRLGESLSFLIVLLFFSGCLKCMIIYQKHFNVLQYRESKQSHHNMMRRGAQLIEMCSNLKMVAVTCFSKRLWRSNSSLVGECLPGGPGQAHAGQVSFVYHGIAVQ